jgi:hypothetical protein
MLLSGGFCLGWTNWSEKPQKESREGFVTAFFPSIFHQNNSIPKQPLLASWSSDSSFDSQTRTRLAPNESV